MSNPASSASASTRATTTTPAVWLVAHDFSPCADAAAELAVEDLLRRREGGHLVLLHIFTLLPPPASIGDNSMAIDFVELERDMRSEIGEKLASVRAALQAKHPELGRDATLDTAMRIATPAEGILAEAERLGASRIIIGTHGRRGVTHLLLGSVAERVVRLAHVPVLVAHAPERAANAHRGTR